MLISFTRSRCFSIVVFVALLGIPASVFAQATGMLQDERAINGISNLGKDYRNGGGVMYGGSIPSATPVNYSYTNNAVTNVGASSLLSQSATANYGSLSVSTSGTSQDALGYLIFTESSTVYGGDVVVGFVDYIKATQAMNVEFKYTVQGTSSLYGSPGSGAAANVTTDYSFGSLGKFDDFTLNGTTTYEGTVSLSANSVTKLFVGLGWDAGAYSDNGYGELSSFNMSAVGNVTLTSLTQGASFTSVSGHDYATPEPASWATLGLGLIGLLRFRLRKTS